MNQRCLKTLGLALASCVALATAAEAIESGSAIQPGTEFPAAPMSKGGFSLSAPTNVIAPAPAGPEMAPAPAPAPKKRRKRRR